jgi:hypothetical protein
LHQILCGVLNAIVCQEQPLRAPRANHVFRTDEKRIRTKNAVMDQSKNGLEWFLYKIIDCVRTASRPRAIDDPRGRAAVRASMKEAFDHDARTQREGICAVE